MPALSPTMDRGTLAAWNVQVGSHFQAGDAVAKIDTDKASIDFEAQDDGYVAKLLVTEGTQDIPVGTPIFVTVEEEDHVAAFSDYVVEEAAAPAAAATPPPPPTPPPAAAAPPAKPAAPPVAAPPPPTPPPAAATAPPKPAAPPTPATAPTPPLTQAPSLGQAIQRTSPIAKTLSASQKAYVEKYGATGQLPI